MSKALPCIQILVIDDEQYEYEDVNTNAMDAGSSQTSCKALPRSCKTDLDTLFDGL